MIVVADTSFVVAVVNQTDARHNDCLSLYQRHNDSILLPQTVLAKVGYMLNRARGNKYVADFLRRLPNTKYRVFPLETDDLLRSATLLDQYADSRLDFVDATVVAVGEHFNITRIFTLDQRDFRIVRPRHCDYFQLFP